MSLRNFNPHIAAALCLTLLQPAIASNPQHPSAKDINPDRILHALNRFTFGPRPGEAAAVQQIGLDVWFERQLNPQSIDDSTLDARLAQFPAMFLSEQDLVRRYPTPLQVRALARNGGPLPTDPIEHAIYVDQLGFYDLAQQKKAGAKSVGEDTPAMTPEQAEKKSESALAAANTDVDDKVLQAAVPAMPQEQLNALLQLPAPDRFTKLLSLSPTELIALRKALKPALQPQLIEGFTPQQKEILVALGGTNRMITSELLQTRLLRDIYSNRQLEAVMTDFWLNHFNIYLRKNQLMPATLPTYERETIRKNALGNFETLLTATAKSPAMLLYLDNATSAGPDSPVARRGEANGAKNKTGLNENYARELMELHTLGVNGGYTQKDVTEVAKVFTGWTINRGNGDGNRQNRRGSMMTTEPGGFVFNERRHEPGSKQVLGHTLREDGEGEGHQVLHLLAISPATAQFLSQKLAIRFVSDNPPQALVDSMAKTFLATNGDIKAVLRTLFHAPEFWSAANDKAKLKTPLEYVVSAACVSGAEITNATPLAQALDRLGMPLYGAQPPTGYKWDAGTWLSSSALVNRMNYALLLSTNKLPGVQIDWTSVFTTERKARITPASLKIEDQRTLKEHKLEVAILGYDASSQTRNTVLSQPDADVAQQVANDFALGADSMRAPMLQKGQRLNQPGRFGGGALQNTPPSDLEAAAMAGLLLGSPEFQRR